MRLAGEFWKVCVHLVRDRIDADVEIASVIVGTLSVGPPVGVLHYPHAGEEFYLVPATLLELVTAEDVKP